MAEYDLVPYEPVADDRICRADEDGNIYGASGSFLASYASRRRLVNTFQGSVPLSPGESFKLKVLEVGTFGEIAIGLSGPRGQATDQNVDVDMVGWLKGEVGFHGDHGRCYVNGHDAKRRSSAWLVGHVVECGLTTSANVYFKHTGGTAATLEMPGRWQISHAYPTVTIRSSGAKVDLDLEGVEQKPLKDLLPHSGPEWGDGAARSKTSALNLLTSFKRIVISEEVCQEGPGVPILERLFGHWCACEEIEVGEAAPRIQA
ncbi:unnamed protein product [Effrenium voratum]|uniref:Uncharacterized protein n=1 Tax=Effrenium voratum TaxID=2562239 RepID=A0AA36NGP3_9DINO|nr:unnamed protein product [Effrenium voratum]CAJ1421644.1 unnamed protein product [Effrenium voratum]